MSQIVVYFLKSCRDCFHILAFWVFLYLEFTRSPRGCSPTQLSGDDELYIICHLPKLFETLETLRIHSSYLTRVYNNVVPLTYCGRTDRCWYWLLISIFFSLCYWWKVTSWNIGTDYQDVQYLNIWHFVFSLREQYLK